MTIRPRTRSLAPACFISPPKGVSPTTYIANIKFLRRLLAMRVRGNISPNALNIEPYAPKPGLVEVRLRDNINPIVETDEMTGQEISMFEYDEYTFVLPDLEGLREHIEANMADWLATGRTLEVNQNASIVADQRRDINAYEQALSEIEAALGVSG